MSECWLEQQVDSRRAKCEDFNLNHKDPGLRSRNVILACQSVQLHAHKVGGCFISYRLTEANVMTFDGDCYRPAKPRDSHESDFSSLNV